MDTFQIISSISNFIFVGFFLFMASQFFSKNQKSITVSGFVGLSVGAFSFGYLLSQINEFNGSLFTFLLNKEYLSDGVVRELKIVILNSFSTIITFSIIFAVTLFFIRKNKESTDVQKYLTWFVVGFCTLFGAFVLQSLLRSLLELAFVGPVDKDLDGAYNIYWAQIFSSFLTLIWTAVFMFYSQKNFFLQKISKNLPSDNK